MVDGCAQNERVRARFQSAMQDSEECPREVLRQRTRLRPMVMPGDS